MPYKRNMKFRYRGGRRPRKKFFKRLVDGASYAGGVLDKVSRYTGPIGSIARSVGLLKSLVNAESKYVDNNSIANQIMLNTGTIYYMTGIPQGTDESQRIGNSVLGNNFYIHFKTIANTLVSVVAPQEYLILVILDKQCDGALPTVSQILQTLSVETMINRDNSKRFVILRRFRGFVSTENWPSRVWKTYIKLPWHLKYDGASGGIGDAKENQIYILTLSEVAVNGPAISVYSRLNYYDN